METAINKLMQDKQIKFGNSKNKNQKDKSKLGSGGYGSVYEVEVTINSKPKTYAMKKITIEHSDKDRFDIINGQTDKELSLSLNLKHRFIVRSKHKFQTGEVFEDSKYKKTFLLLMDKAKYPNLSAFAKALSKKTNDNNELKLHLFDVSKGSENYEWFGRMNEHLAKFFMKQILYGLEYLHRNCLMHFDLKLGNVLITKGMQLKLCDFSLTTYVNYLEKKSYEKEKRF